MARRAKPQGTAAIEAAAKRLREVERNLAKQQKQARKEFEHGFAVLRRKGLINPKLHVKDIRSTRYRKQQLRDLSGILTGDLAAVKAPRKAVKEFREQGARVIRGRILVAKHPEEIAKVRKGELTESVITLNRPLRGEYVSERIILPVKYSSLRAFIEGIRENPERFDKLKNAVDNFAFQVGGNNTYQTAFTSMRELAEYLERYESLLEWAEENPDEDASEFLSLHRVRVGFKLDSGDTNPRSRALGLSRAAKSSQDRRAARLREMGTAVTPAAPRAPAKTGAQRTAEYRARNPDAVEVNRIRAREASRLRPRRNPYRGNIFQDD